MTKQEIGQILKASREAKGLTQKQVAEMLGRRQQVIGHWETGYAQPDANTLFELCDIYDIDVDAAFRQKPVPTDVLHISYGSGDRNTDEIRKQLHDLIDEMADEDLRLLQDITLRMKRE